MLALRDAQFELRFPFCAAGLPTPGDRGKAGMHLLTVQVDLDWSRPCGRIQSHKRVLGRDREINVVLRLIRQHACIPNTGKLVGVRLAWQADSHVAAIEPIGTDCQAGHGRLLGARGFTTAYEGKRDNHC